MSDLYKKYEKEYFKSLKILLEDKYVLNSEEFGVKKELKHVFTTEEEFRKVAKKCRKGKFLDENNDLQWLYPVYNW